MKGSWSKGFMMEEKPEKPARISVASSRREHGGVKVTASNVTDANTLPDGRYKFRIEGEAPRSLVLTDIGTMLEARFSGEAGVKLDASREQRIMDVRAKYEASQTAADNERARHQASIAAVEKRREELEKEYQAKLGNWFVERQAVERQISEAKYRLTQVEQSIRDTEKKMASMVVSDGTTVQVAPDIEAKVESILQSWQESLEEYGNPLPAEWSDLSNRIAQMLTHVVDQTKDKMRREVT